MILTSSGFPRKQVVTGIFWLTTESTGGRRNWYSLNVDSKPSVRDVTLEAETETKRVGEELKGWRKNGDIYTNGFYFPEMFLNKEYWKTLFRETEVESLGWENTKRMLTFDPFSAISDYSRIPNATWCETFVEFL